MYSWLKQKLFAAPSPSAAEQTRSIENPAQPLNSPWYGPPTLSGVRVDEFNALHYSAFCSGVRTISVDVASLRLQPFRSLIGGGKAPAQDHWTHEVVYVTPDGLRPAVRFWASMVQYAITWGNGYAEIEWTNGGKGLALHILPASRVIPRWEGSRLKYDFLGTDERKQKTLEPFQIIHIANPMSYDGIVGLGVVTMARESIGLGLSGELSMAAFYGNSAKPGGTINMSPAMSAQGDKSEQARKTLREYVDAVHQGPMNNGRMMYLFDGVTYAPNQLPPPDEAYLKSREFQLQEIARWLNMPPTKIGDYSRATFSNIEQANMDYLNQTIRPWAEFICAELNLKLFSVNERKSLFIKPNYHELLKADSVARSAYYASGRQWGWLSVNEVRELEHYPNSGDAGDILLSPTNMVNSEALLSPDYVPPTLTPTPGEPVPTNSLPSKPDDKPNEAASALREVVRGEIGRLLRRESAALQRAAKKPDFLDSVETLYAEHGETICQHLSPSVRAYGLLLGKSFDIPALARNWVERSRADVLGVEAVCTSDQLSSAIDDLAKRWNEDGIISMLA